jgi:hypothetical protein
MLSANMGAVQSFGWLASVSTPRACSAARQAEELQITSPVTSNDRSGIVRQWHRRWADTESARAMLHQQVSNDVKAPCTTCLCHSTASAAEQRENYTVVQRNLALELVRVTEV